VLLAGTEDELDPVLHADVPALPVDVYVARSSLRGDGEMAANAVRAETEVA
jgi:hypothetical protein